MSTPPLNSGSEMMQLFRYILICCLLLLKNFALSSQSQSASSFNGIRETAESQYGPDLDLLNGRKYNFTYRSARGNPFFEAPGANSAAIQIKGKLYENQSIRFDIYQQLLILDFIDLSGGNSSIVLNDEVVDQFTLGEVHFRKFSDKNGLKRFGQVVYLDRISCVYFWKKKYLSELKEEQKNYRFSGPLRDAVIISNGQVRAYKNKSSFLKCFGQGDRKKIKLFMREQLINPRKANDLEMQRLMKYINQLSGHED